MKKKGVFKLRFKVASVHTIPLCWRIKESDTKCRKHFLLGRLQQPNYYWTLKRLPLAECWRDHFRRRENYVQPEQKS